MSKIVITKRGGTWSAAALMEFKRLTGIALTVIKEASAGDPIFECELFLNDHDAVAVALRGVMALDRSEGLSLGYFELEPDEDFATAPLDRCQIDAGILENILAEADSLSR